MNKSDQILPRNKKEMKQMVGKRKEGKVNCIVRLD